jgi:hypothetical protein
MLSRNLVQILGVQTRVRQKKKKKKMRLFFGSVVFAGVAAATPTLRFLHLDESACRERMLAAANSTWVTGAGGASFANWATSAVGTVAPGNATFTLCTGTCAEEGLCAEAVVCFCFCFFFVCFIDHSVKEIFCFIKKCVERAVFSGGFFFFLFFGVVKSI